MRYLDSSSLVALYYREAKTEALNDHLQKGTGILVFTHLQEAEVINGLRLKLFRQEAEPGKIQATLEILQEDMKSGVLHRTSVSWPLFFATMFDLSAKYSEEIGTRTLDLLHIAVALTLKADEFITGDARQAEAAKKENLQTVFI